MRHERKLIGGSPEPEEILDLSVKPDEAAKALEQAGAQALPGNPDEDFEGGYYGERTHLRDYWRVLWKRAWLILAIVVASTVAAAVYQAREPDIYQSQVRIQVDLENSASIGGTQGSAVLLSSQGNDPAYFNTQLQVLTGTGLLRRVVKTLDLEHNKDFIKPLLNENDTTFENLKRMVGLGTRKREQTAQEANELPLTTSVAPASSRDDLKEARRLAPFVKAIQSRMSVEPVRERRLPVKETRLIDIKFTHPNPQIAARLVNTLADSFVLSNLERKTEANTTTSDFLQKRIAELQDSIRSGEESLLTYAKNKEILSLDNSQDTVVQRLTALSSQLIAAENERKLAEAALRANTAPDALGVLARNANAQVVALEGKLKELKLQRDQLLVENTEKWPDVQLVNQQIVTVEKQLADVRRESVTDFRVPLETRHRQAVANEQAVRAAYNKARSETLSQNEAAVNYRIIQQEIQTNKSLLQGLLQRSKENDVILAGMPNNIHVIDYAVVPEYPIGPARFQGVVIAFFLSLVCGVGLAFLLNYLDDSLKSAEDVEQAMRLPALAVIPSMQALSPRRLLPARLNALPRRRRSSDDGLQEFDPVILFNAKPNSALAEAYKHLRTSLMLSSPEKPPQTILITSCQPHEGKTTTSINLAVSMAQTDSRVLLIDADMRHPRHHKLLGLARGPGLSNVLSSNMTAAEILDAVRVHEPTGVHCLCAGTVPPNPAELLGSKRMVKLVETLEANYDYIIIDSPPVGFFTDSLLLATVVDGVFMVVDGNKYAHHLARRTRRMLSSLGVKLFGVVLNNVRQTPHDYYYYDKYYRAAETEAA